MPQWIKDILAIFTGIFTEAQFEQLFAALAEYLMTVLLGLFPATASQKLDEVVAAGERISMHVTTDAATSMALIQAKYPTYEALERRMPGIMQSIHAKDILMDDCRVPHSVAAHAIQLGFANGKVKTTDFLNLAVRVQRP